MSQSPETGYRKRWFTTEGFDTSFEGWAPVGSPPELAELHSRGWHAPLFERPVALAIIEELQRLPVGILRAEYEVGTDTFLIEEDGNDPITWPGMTIWVAGEPRIVYAIGNEEWEWSVVPEEVTSR